MIGARRDRELQETDSGAPEEPMNEPMTADSVISCTCGFPSCDEYWCDGTSSDCTPEEGYCNCDAGSNFCATGINPCESGPGCNRYGYPACRDDGSWCDGTSYDCAQGYCDCDVGSNFCAGGINPCLGVTGESEPVLEYFQPALDVGNIEVDGPCLICKDGIAVNEFSYWTVDEEDCETVVKNYKDFAAEGSELCELAEGTYQERCCPTPAENPCAVCPNGVTATTISDALMNAMTDDAMDGEFSLDEWCSIVPSFQQFEADSDECDQGFVEEIEAVCCPTTPKNPCSVCPNTGITVDDNYCEYDLELSKVLEADTLRCKEIQFEEFLCCPTLAKTPCSLCQDNDSFNADKMLNDGSGITCGGVSLATEEGSEACEYVKDSWFGSQCCLGVCHAFMYYPACDDRDWSWCDGTSVDCTSEEGYCDCDAGSNFCADGINPCSKTPCSLCQDNDSFNADKMLNDGSGMTCGGLSLATEEGSEACEYVKDSFFDLEFCCLGVTGESEPVCHAFEGYPVCRDDGEYCDGSYDCTSEEGYCDCDAGSNFCDGGMNPCSPGEYPEVGEESVEAIMDNDPIMHPLVDSKAAKVYATKTASKSAKAFNGKGSKGTKAYSKSTKAHNGKGSKASHLF